MKKVLKWMGIVVGILLGIIVLAVIVLSINGSAQFSQTREVLGEQIAIPTNEEAVARGKHWVEVSCAGCHGADLSGALVVEDPALATIYGSNISGLAETHTDEEIVRAIRHAVDSNGRQLIVMPAESFIHFSQEDLGAIVAYLKTVPRVGEEQPAPQPGPVGRILMGAGILSNLFPASYIDHNMPFPEMPEVGANEAYGEYISRFCFACHGDNLAGGQPSNPASPAAPNLTMGGELQGWTQADFIKAMHSGVTPTGRQLNPDFMPYESFGKLADEELTGLWMYLQSQSPVQTAVE